MDRNTSVSLGPYFDGFIQNLISAGRYKNASEVVRAGLRLLEEEENKLLALKDALQKGEDSGFVQDFDREDFLKQMKAKAQSSGLLHEQGDLKNKARTK